MTMSTSNAAAQAALNARTALVDAGSGPGKVRIYSGTPPAGGPDAALSGNTLLAELTMSDPSFPPATDTNPGARSVANAVSDDTDADATGTATFFRIVDSDDTPHLQGTAGTAGTDMILDSASVTAGQTVGVTSITLNQPES